MKTKKITLMMLLFIGTMSTAFLQNLTQNKAKTTVEFKIKNIGIYVDGTFSDIKVESNFIESNLSESHFNATISISSLSTGIDARDESLSEEDYFDAEKYKTIQLKSTQIEKKGEGKYVLTAKLTIKSTTKSISIPFNYSKEGDNLVFTSEFTINRRDYDIGGSSWVMSDDVIVNINYVANK